MGVEVKDQGSRTLEESREEFESAGEDQVNQGALAPSEMQESSEAVKPQVDRTVEHLREQARTVTAAKPPRLLENGVTTPAAYAEFVGDCLASVAEYIRSTSGSDALLASLAAMTLKFSATPGVLNLLLYAEGETNPGIIAGVQDIPLREKDSIAVRTQRWTLVSVLAGGSDCTNDYLNIPVATSLPFFRNLEEESRGYNRWENLYRAK
jgi:hypothetical protein